MYETNLKLGKIIRIDGLHIIVEITEKNIANKLSTKRGTNDFAVSVNKLVFSELPNGKKIVGRISKIYDKQIFEEETIFSNFPEKFLINVELIGIYDEFLEKFDTGICNFPIIGSDIFSANSNIQKAVMSINSKYKLEIGKSYFYDLPIYANPDILFGKHLGIFGNTGTGKTCTIASLIQGLKRRLTKNGETVVNNPKIIIFDSNNEYKRAFENNNEFSIKEIKKEDIKLPHYYLDFPEYYKLLNASQGTQMPALKEAIVSLKNENPCFSFSKLPDELDNYINRMSGSNNFNRNNFQNWLNTLIIRIQRIIEDDKLISILDTDENTVEEIFNSDKEIFLINSDFDKEELDIIMFLFSKILYRKAVENPNKNVLLLFEEAHRYINEDDKQDYKLGHYYIERLAREGRKFGISLIISSQRPSELSQTIISQCNSYIVHRITNKRDLELINKIISSNNQGVLGMIPGLEQQYAIAIGEAFGYSDIIKIYDASPTPNSNDPQVIENWIRRE